MRTRVKLLAMALNVVQDHSVSAASFFEDPITFIHGSFGFSMKVGQSGFTSEARERPKVHAVDIVVSNWYLSKMHGNRTLEIQIKDILPRQLRINMVPYACTRFVAG